MNRCRRKFKRRGEFPWNSESPRYVCVCAVFTIQMCFDVEAYCLIIFIAANQHFDMIFYIGNYYVHSSTPNNRVYVYELYSWIQPIILINTTDSDYCWLSLHTFGSWPFSLQTDCVSSSNCVGGIKWYS